MTDICCQIFKQSRELFLCEWLKQAVVCRVITSFGEQDGRHNIIRDFFFTDNMHSGLMLVDLCLESMGFRSN